jgi:hypothetical protein
VRGCVGAWVRGCVGAWVRGCVGAWVRGWPGAWVAGCLGARVRGCVGAWVRGCAGAWCIHNAAPAPVVTEAAGVRPLLTVHSGVLFQASGVRREIPALHALQPVLANANTAHDPPYPLRTEQVAWIRAGR